MEKSGSLNCIQECTWLKKRNIQLLIQPFLFLKYRSTLPAQEEYFCMTDLLLIYSDTGLPGNF